MKQIEIACIPIGIELEVLAHYAKELGLTSSEQALLTLAKAISTSEGLDLPDPCCLVIRYDPKPIMCLFSPLNTKNPQRLITQANKLNSICRHLRYLNYSRAEQISQRLGRLLEEKYGDEQLSQFHYTAIPRGGQIILMYLSYILQLRSSNLHFPENTRVPLIVIDDCAYTGARLREFLASHANLPNPIIFATLYSHPGLRQAILEQEPRVSACISAYDLHEIDNSPKLNEHQRSEWLLRLGGQGYWLGQTEHVCFPWSEPDRSIFDFGSGEVTAAWRAIPPDYCLKNRFRTPVRPLPIQVQPAGPGPWQPTAETVYADFPDRVIIYHLSRQKTFGLENVAAEMWRQIVKTGDFEATLQQLLGMYDVASEVLRADLANFIQTLSSMDLLEPGKI